MAKDAYYFTHDANASHDPKMLKLRTKHGWGGIGMYWSLVESMRQEEDYQLNLCDVDAFALDMQCDVDALNLFINDCVKIGLFTENDGVIFSESLCRRMSSMDEKREKARQSAIARWQGKSERKANAKRTQSDSNAIRVNKSKIYKEKFDIFWSHYPKKIAKTEALKSFSKIDLSNGLLDKIISSLENQKQSQAWLKDNGQFIPHASTWLNQKRWEDETIRNVTESKYTGS